MFLNNMDEFIRTFIAIDPDSDAKEKILKLVLDLKGHIRGDVSWTKKENLHFTLKFLGEISFERLTKTINTLQQIKDLYAPFNVSVSQIGIFPNSLRPRIVWLGIREGKDQMINLARDIDEALQLEGFSREKREFTAHLTIGRIRSLPPKFDLIPVQKLADKIICRFIADKIILYKSELQHQGPVYSIISEFPLKEI